MINIPTIAELQAQIQADLESQTGFSLSTVGKVFLYPLSLVLAGVHKLVYLTIGNTQKNIFIDTAEPEAIGGTLERFGRIKLKRNPFPAQAGQYSVTVTGTVGATVPALTTFKSDDSSANPGKLFILDAAHILIASPDTITIRALVSGADSKLLVSDTLTATAPMTGVNAAAIVTAQVVEPKAQEDLEVYRAKGILAYQLEPEGGASTDYRLWSYDAQGVQQVYPYARSGYTGEVNLYVEATTADSTDGKGTPSAGLLTDVEAVVEFDPDATQPLNARGRRPTQAIVNFLPITVREVDININGFVGNTVDITAAILAAMTAEVNKTRPFVAAADILDNKNDILDTNKIISIILSAKPGSTFGAITLKIDGTPLSTFTFLNGDIPHLNSVTYI